jgi:TonB family protein
MRWSVIGSLLGTCLVCMVFCGNQDGLAQALDAPPEVEFVQLSPPLYPPLARQAWIKGDVNVQIKIRPDGSVTSAEVMSGHPMLAQAAMESAQRSKFECRGCSGVTEYSVTYTFAIGEQCHNAPDCSAVEEPRPEIRQSLSHVVLTVAPSCTCDPVARITRIKRRSAKCL